MSHVRLAPSASRAGLAQPRHDLTIETSAGKVIPARVQSALALHAGTDEANRYWTAVQPLKNDPEALRTETLKWVRLSDPSLTPLSQPAHSSPARAAASSQQSSPPLPDSGRTAVRAANWVIALAFLGVLFGVIGGIIIALQTEVSGSGWSRDETRPYVGYGLGLVFAAVLQAAVLIMIAAYVKYRVESTQRSR